MRSWGLRRQLVLLVVVPFMVVSTGTGLVILGNYYKELRLLDARQGQRVARMLGLLAAPALERGDTAELQRLVNSAVEDRYILQASILGADNSLLVSAGQTPPETSSHQVHRYPVFAVNTVAQSIGNVSPDERISAGNGLRGWISLSTSQSTASHARYQTLTSSLLVILSGLLAIAFLGGRLIQHLQQRFTQLHTTLATLDRDDWNSRLPLHDSPEWQDLAESVNQLALRTRERMARLQSEATHSHEDLQATLENLEISNIELDLARREAQSAAQIKSDFLANTSHEIRTPLSGIIGFTNVLLQLEVEPRKREYLSSVKHAAENLLAILNDILDLSKIEAGKFVLEQRPFSLLEAVEDSARLFAEQAAAKGVELIIECDPMLPRQLEGDPLRIKQIVTNLISNAVKFTDRGQVLIRLGHESVDQGQSRLTIVVGDTGIGIADHERVRLFEAFQQADRSDTRQRGGTGLGLTIVQNLARHMNAELDLDSSPGKGSTFTLRLTLPLCPEQTSPPKSALGPLYVYDPNADTRRAVQSLLKRNGITATLLSDPAQIEERVDTETTLILGLGTNQSVDDAPISPANCKRLVLLLPSLSQVPDGVTCVPKPAAEQALLDALSPPLLLDKVPAVDQQARVLVVDDHAGNRQLLEVLLSSAGAKPELCESGQQAIRRCRQESFQLILVDLQMPELNGCDTVQQLRQTPLNRHAHIIALSAADTQEQRQVLHNAGFDDCLLKPITMPQIRQALAAARSTPVDMTDGMARSNHNADIAEALLARFLALLPAQIKAFERERQKGDIEALHSLTHQLLGATAYVGTPILRSALESLWSALNADAPDTDTIAPLAEAVTRELQRLLAYDSNITSA